MYVDLQNQVKAKSPIIIMFQAAYQVAMHKDVSGYVNGATSDFVTTGWSKRASRAC